MAFVLFVLQTTSRAGWHSPEDDTLSPKSDASNPYHNMVKSLTTSPKRIFRNKSNTLETSVTTHHTTFYSKSVDASQFTRTLEVRNLRQSDFTPTPPIASKLNGSVPKFATTTAAMPNHTLSYCSTTTTSSSSSEMLEQRTVNRYEYDGQSTGGVVSVGGYGTNGGNATNQPFQPKYSSANMPKYENTYHHYGIDKSRTQIHADTEALSTSESFNGTYQKQNGILPNRNGVPNEGRYGKILNRSVANEPHHFNNSNGGGSTAVGITMANNYHPPHSHDRYNANVKFHQPMLDNGTDNCANNNSPIQLHVAKGNGYANCIPTTNNGVAALHCNSGSMPFNGTTVTVAATPRASNKETANGNGLIRGHHTSHHRYSNGTHLTAPGNHPLAHVIGSLSSPESAYSTGYSTDGTSPGEKLILILILWEYVEVCMDDPC